MKKLWRCVLSLSIFCTAMQSIAAEIHLYSRSIRCSPVRLEDPTETMYLTTDISYPPATLNGELKPSPSLGTNYLDGEYVVTTPRIAKLIMDEIYFGLPPYSDVNSNGIPDFYEVSQPLVEERTQGFFDD